MTFPFADVSAASLTDLLSLSGRRAVITGGAQGLGRAIAERLAEAGASIAIADLDAGRADAAATAIADLHAVAAVGVAMDVADSASVAEATDRVVGVLGGVDIWVNNAGVFPSAPVLEMSDEQWDHVFAVNTRGVRNGAREAARRMTDGGVVVNVVSTAGFRGIAPGLSAYVGSKHAVRGMTKQMALEFAPRGIRVLGVAPSYVPTEGNMAAAAAAMEKMAAAGTDLSSMPAAMSYSLIGRVGTPDDIARVVLFCASDLSLVMTGSTLLADAGETI
ncbi:SDR family NAD(P)-dependent oxidoreductase [Microbacterium sp. Root180]|uniref:SDR family NAD(P)-dependent oxidoreductase n=1 Tax=Microbacterium sp. Root180 TaxID=1736483 RepID=UPI0006F46F72|nr:SDR family oxidoreductase [Microbacterium sp. Root180]KRB35148.1 short-chain dehydrogenase [Microbacterium sp. Root180]